jgi:hypothetical protein
LIYAQYILDILDLAFDGHAESELLRKQIPLLSIKGVEHTGIGAFIHFVSDKPIQQFQLDTANAINFDLEGNAISMVDGIAIKNPELSILADAIVHLKNGIIDHLEIWNKCGENYVGTEPQHYQLDQIWLDKHQRKTIIR